MVTPTFLPKVGGAEYQIKWLTEELVKQHHKISLIVPEYSKEFIEKNMKNYDFESYYLKTGGNYNHLTNVIRVYRYLKKIQPDVIHLHFLYPWGMYLYFLKKFKLIDNPIIVTSHGIDLIQNKYFEDYYQNSKLKSKIIKRIAKCVDKIVIVSKQMWNDAVASGVPESKLEVIHNGYSENKTSVSKNSIEKIKNIYSIKKSDTILVFVGRIRKEKGLEYLIPAVEELERNFNIKLFIIGDGEYKKQLKTNSNNIIFIGKKTGEGKLAFVKLADIFCMPSIEETFGISLFDPMYFEKPIIASRVGGIVEILDNESGVLVEPGSSSEIKNAIKHLVNNPELRVNLGKKARKRLEKFNMAKIAQKYNNLYKEVRI